MRGWFHHLNAGPGEPSMYLEGDDGEHVIGVDPWCAEFRPGRGKHWFLNVTAKGVRIELCMSPQGKNAQLYVNGSRVELGGKS